jgi:hypothetical protein
MVEFERWRGVARTENNVGVRASPRTTRKRDELGEEDQSDQWHTGEVLMLSQALHRRKGGGAHGIRGEESRATRLVSVALDLGCGVVSLGMAATEVGRRCAPGRWVTRDRS